MPGLFITGTDTDVGKTLISAGLARILKKKGCNVGVMKPYATADSYHSARYRSKDTAILAEAAGLNEKDVNLNPVFYKLAASPLAASLLLEEPQPDIISVVNSYVELEKSYDFIIVEGIGGIAVPLDSSHIVADLIKLLELPLVIVAENRIGMINHCILTAQICRQYKLDVRGIIFNKKTVDFSTIDDISIRIISNLSGIGSLGMVPYIEDVDFVKVASYLENIIDINLFLKMK